MSEFIQTLMFDICFLTVLLLLGFALVTSIANTLHSRVLYHVGSIFAGAMIGVGILFLVVFPDWKPALLIIASIGLAVISLRSAERLIAKDEKVEQGLSERGGVP